MFNALAYLAPILLVGALVLGSRLPLIVAGLCGLAATLLAVSLTPLPYWPMVQTEMLKGAWLALYSGAMVLAGLVFHHTLSCNETTATDAPRRPHFQAFVLCFIAAPVVESAVGFGVGFAVAIGGLMRLGLKPVRAAVIGMISQMLVPWGALGIGTLVGASLVQLPLQGFGLHSAYVISPALLILLGWFWHGMAKSGITATPREHLSEFGLLLALIALLILANRAGAVDSAGLLATAPLLALLLLTRLVPSIGNALKAILAWQPFPDMPAFPLLHYAGSLLLLTALLTLASQGGFARLPDILAKSWRGGRLAVSATLLFLIMARLYTGSGMAAELAARWTSFAGEAAPFGTPVFAGLAGLLTGSNTASNSLMLPIQVALAAQSGAPLLWLAALQNTTGSLLTSLFPGKLALACAFAGIPGQERVVLRATLPYAALMLLTALALVSAIQLFA